MKARHGQAWHFQERNPRTAIDRHVLVGCKGGGLGPTTFYQLVVCVHFVSIFDSIPTLPKSQTSHAVISFTLTAFFLKMESCKHVFILCSILALESMYREGGQKQLRRDGGER